MVMQRIQPHVKKIQVDHKENKEKQAQALLALYREHRINPFSSFFLLLVQIPVLIALYKVFLGGLSPDTFRDLYSFVAAPGDINHISLGLINLSEPDTIIVGLAVIAQYFQAKWSMAQQSSTGKGDPAQDMAARMGRQMVIIGPLITLLFLMRLPSAVGIYWLTTSVFSIIQQKIITKSFANDHGSISRKSETTRSDDGVK